MDDVTTIHDLAAAHGMPAVEAWIGGDLALGDAAPLTPAERRLILGDWSFWARPGQRWTPGKERVTLLSGGRRGGKTLVGAHAIHEAALDPERWGGEALIIGPEPMHVRNKCLGGPSGVLTLARAFGSRYMVPRHNQQNRTLTFPAPHGGGDGLRVTYASSADPKSVRGDGVGLLWGDEFAFWYFERRDDNGNNAWEASAGCMSGGRDPKVLLTTTPSETPDVDALFDLAESPTCPRCKTRLPPLEGTRVSPLFAATSTAVLRFCPVCLAGATTGGANWADAHAAASVIAEVRVVILPTLDNVALPVNLRETAARKLATGRARNIREWSGRRAASQGALVRKDDLRLVPVALPPQAVLRDPAVGRCDWEMQVLAGLGVVMVGVFIDPAVTSAEGSCDTGVCVVGARPCPQPGPADEFESLLLEDCTVPPERVDGAPSATWAPVAAEAAVRWGASWAAVETNQGGDEVLDALRRAFAADKFPGETGTIAAILAERGGLRAVAIHEAKRRLVARALLDRPDRVLGHRRVATKRARWGWLGDVAAEGRIAFVTLEHLGGEEHIARVRRQLTAWVPDPRRPASATSEPRDSADAFVAACQLLLGVTEARGEVVDHGGAAGGPGSMSSQVAALGRDRA